MADQKENVLSIILRGLAPFISQVSYERDEQDVSLYLGLKEGELRPEDLVIKRAGSNLTIILTKPEEK